jgi:hypothetical protein
VQPMSVLSGHSHTPRRHPADCGGQPGLRASFSQVSDAFRVQGRTAGPGGRQITNALLAGLMGSLISEGGGEDEDDLMPDLAPGSTGMSYHAALKVVLKADDQ